MHRGSQRSRVGVRQVAVVTPLVALCCVLARPASAEVPDTPAWRYNVGFRLGAGIVLLLPAEEEASAGGGFELEGRYGVPVGPIVVAPGAEVGGYYLSSRVIGQLLPTLRVTLPAGPLAPFVRGGLGVGGMTNPGDGGVAWLAGGGLMIHIEGAVSFGAELSYQGITGTGYEVLSIAPSIIIGG